VGVGKLFRVLLSGFGIAPSRCSAGFFMSLLWRTKATFKRGSVIEEWLTTLTVKGILIYNDHKVVSNHDWKSVVYWTG